MFSKEELQNIGEGFYNRGNYPYALELLSKVIQEDPENTQARLWKSWCHRWLNQEDEAEKEFEEACKVGPQHPDILRAKAERAIHAKKFDQLKELAADIPVGTRDTDFLIEYFAQLLFDYGYHETSYHLVSGSLYTGHERLEWQNLLALGEFATAEKKLQKLMKIDPTNPELWLGLAEAAHYLGNHTKALEYLTDECIDHFLRDPDYYHFMGLIYTQLGERKKAIDCFEDVIRRDASHLLAYKNMAIVHEQNGNRKDAVQYLKKAQALRYAEWHDNEVDRLLNLYDRN